MSSGSPTVFHVMFTSDEPGSGSLRLTMTASARSTEDESCQAIQVGPSEPQPSGTSEPTANLRMSSGDRCAECGSALAIDQRYCVECGTRRGRPRFAIASAGAQDASTAAASRATGGWSRTTAL